MSYDICLVDRLTGDTLTIDKPHFVAGGTYAIGGTQELWLNITYNYARYYYEAAADDPRFAYAKSGDADLGKIDSTCISYGIRGIYGKTGAESIPMLKDMIHRIEDKYKDENGWIDTKRIKHRWRDQNGKVYTDPYDFVISKDPMEQEDYEVVVNEGPNDNYWEPTAGNAIRPLYQLIAFAQMRPDGVWDGD